MFSSLTIIAVFLNAGSLVTIWPMHCPMVSPGHMVRSLHVRFLGTAFVLGPPFYFSFSAFGLCPVNSSTTRRGDGSKPSWTAEITGIELSGQTGHWTCKKKHLHSAHLCPKYCTPCYVKRAVKSALHRLSIHVGWISCKLEKWLVSCLRLKHFLSVWVAPFLLYMEFL